MITKNDLIKIFKNLNLQNKYVVVHSSYKKLPDINGGAQTVVEALIESFDTVMVPTFSYKNVAKYNTKNLPLQNGCDYSFYENWNRPIIPYNKNDKFIEKNMGIIASLINSHPLSVRSATPWHSWAVIGFKKDVLVNDVTYDDTDLPLKRFAAMGAYCLLLGVDFSSCSAIHIAEEEVGRRKFIRWVSDENGKTKKIFVQGCGEGFNNLYPYLKNKVIHSNMLGVPIMAIKLKDVINISKKAIIENKEITRCSSSCIKCRDMILGGAIDV